ncbi:DUF2716 domain-containing protein [Bacillus sp. FJAT-51639]|uniref:DUF2716 domain-containing protein n=1 Tax=Bacillus bruguierae TaxID=3127667 RepID=A0ABU8FDS8_9BACI
MKNWIELSNKEYEIIWDRIYKEFKFKPSVSQFPSFNVPSPFITYDISKYLNWSGNLNEYDDIYNDLEEKALLAFQEVTQKNEYIYALDWQHDCYWVNPYLEFTKDEFGEWTIPIFPNGDYYLFIHKNLEWAYLGNPWESTITVFGVELLQAFDKHKPRMFNTILRKG